jgi:hypothetical protein
VINRAAANVARLDRGAILDEARPHVAQDGPAIALTASRSTA